MSTKTSTQTRETRIQRLLRGTVLGERYCSADFQQRTGWSSATTRVVIGYAIEQGLLRSEGPQRKRRFLRTIPHESNSGNTVERAALEQYDTAWRTHQSLCMATRRC
ncbi:hypothetical protein [Paraburkholderia heleia]|uniref:hypothetical protein n=1 Tax=Paraburkholderia heleia TaxID=634127 RepID=UPI002AB70F38|nr:hypothetical protein [Paraburkholderia heleia]